MSIASRVSSLVFNEAQCCLLLGAALVSGVAQAQVLEQRCNTDSLDPVQAERRLNWARQCAIRLHVRTTANMQPMAVESGDCATDLTPLHDYREIAPDYREPKFQYYSDPGLYDENAANVGQVNATVNAHLYLPGATSQTTDSNGWWVWSKPKRKLTPYYPTYGSSADIVIGQQLYPHPDLANRELPLPTDCNLYSDREGKNRTGVFFNNGYCRSSCYTPEQEVLFAGGSFQIADALEERRRDLVTLTPESTLDDIRLQIGQTAAYVAEFRDSQHPIVEVNTASGGLLRVTLEHPVVNGDGRLVTAKELKVGDELVKRDGTRDEIVKIDNSAHFGKVYNLQPVGADRVSNLLIAQGYVVGSALFQDDEIGFINRTILYDSVPPDVIP